MDLEIRVKIHTNVRCCDPAFIGSCHVGVSKRFSRSISLAVYTVFTHFYFG